MLACPDFHFEITKLDGKWEFWGTKVRQTAPNDSCAKTNHFFRRRAILRSVGMENSPHCGAIFNYYMYSGALLAKPMEFIIIRFNLIKEFFR